MGFLPDAIWEKVRETMLTNSEKEITKCLCLEALRPDQDNNLDFVVETVMGGLLNVWASEDHWNKHYEQIEVQVREICDIQISNFDSKMSALYKQAAKNQHKLLKEFWGTR